MRSSSGAAGPRPSDPLIRRPIRPTPPSLWAQKDGAMSVMRSAARRGAGGEGRVVYRAVRGDPGPANAESRLKTSTPSQLLTERLRPGRSPKARVDRGNGSCSRRPRIRSAGGFSPPARPLASPARPSGRRTMCDLPAVMGRLWRRMRGARCRGVEADPARYPDYYLQAFHHQIGGWPTEGRPPPTSRWRCCSPVPRRRGSGASARSCSG